MKKILLITSAGVIAMLLWTVMADSAWTEYVEHQEAYKALLVEADPSVVYPIKVRQLVLGKMGEIDRCVSCHVGMEDPQMANQANPIKTHPGDYLTVHDIQKIGCTVCHDGQGSAMTREEAHANTFKHWEKKRLSLEFVQANCTRCHNEDSPSMLPAFARGRDLFREKGCLGCHKLRGKGGHMGPDLTDIGNASTHMKMPTEGARKELLDKFQGNVNMAYIYEAILTPKAQPSASKMFEYKLSAEEALSLTMYIKSFSVSSVPDELRPPVDIVHVPNGRELFATYCSACHGSDGMGTRHPELSQIGPAVANENFLAIADMDFVYHKTFYSGNPSMPAWGLSGGLTDEQIRKVSRYLLSLKTAPPTLKALSSREGNAKFGRIQFAAKCASCHGIDGAHEMDLIGPTLNSPEFKSYADREFMYRTIAYGRSGTAMPGWYFLSPDDLADLLAYLAPAEAPASGYADAVKHMKVARATKWGKARYSKLCMSCHGDEGSGNVGPSLNSPEMQTLASNEFLYKTIIAGRRGTAMGRWAHLSSEDIGWLMAYIRSISPTKTARRFAVREVLGSEYNGDRIFATSCAQCHGPQGNGHIAPAIGNHDFLTVASDSFIKETAAYGRTGTGMKGNLKGQGGTVSLSERELNDVTSYLRSLRNKPRSLAGVTQGDISLGRDRFARTCAQCHGPVGSGGKGPGIGRKGFVSQVSDGFIIGTIANGRTGTEMKGFTAGAGGLVEMDEHEIRSVVTYLRSGADLSKIRRLVVDGTPANGEKLYKTQCGQCHGDWNARSFAPHLTNKVFLKAASDAYLQTTMALGRHDSAMRSMMRGGGGVVEMTSKEVNDIISYLRKSEKLQNKNGRK